VGGLRTLHYFVRGFLLFSTRLASSSRFVSRGGFCWNQASARATFSRKELTSGPSSFEGLCDKIFSRCLLTTDSTGQCNASSNTWAGVLNPRVFLGREFNFAAIL